ncbi:methyl-accepting chemotaxis protein [Rhizobium sp.]|jgi:methyl-accepting chemotaxis protein|uniref:methyl-accepting chemotaxis protein n=1 Tax=Rhizobium sp. TaxID=391 RepID=UPI000E85C20A|nr:methyl-accepting chemotaxis protein [Rhizobium sp.]
MKNVPIIGKFLTIMAVFGLFALMVAIYSDSQIKGVDSRYKGLLSEESTAAINLSRANRGLQGARAAIGEVLMARTDELNASATKDLEKRHDDFIKYMDLSIAALPRDQRIKDLKTDGLAILDQSCKASIDAGREATEGDAIFASQQMFLDQCQPKFGPLSDRFTVVVQEVVRSVDRATAQVSSSARSSAIVTMVGIVGGVLAVMLLGFFAIRAWIVAPVRGLASVMGTLASGNFTATVAGAERRDEIGGMAQAVQVFKDNGLRALELENEAKANRTQSEAERARIAAADRHRAEEMSQATSGLATGLKRLSEGDLGFRLSEPFASDFEALRNDFNTAVNQLAQTIGAVSEATFSIDNGTREISRSAEDLSKRTEQQAAALEETAAALDQITANVSNSSQRAQEARQVAAEANQSAKKSGEVVSNAINAMQRIEQSSSQISNIIGVIDEIAFQTNLLALNAGVEAARAGEAGKGFAVVAQEVRELAQRSAQAAKEIKDLIRNSANEVSTGVTLVEETGMALKVIEQQVVTINTQLDAIATSAKEQSVGLAEVNTAVNQMDQVTQQNAAMVEESTAASANLSLEVDQLRNRIALFQLGGAAGRSVARAPASVTSVTPSYRPAASPTRKILAKVANAVGGAVGRPAAQSAGGNWEEF